MRAQTLWEQRRARTFATQHLPSPAPRGLLIIPTERVTLLVEAPQEVPRWWDPVWLIAPLEETKEEVSAYLLLCADVSYFSFAVVMIKH